MDDDATLNPRQRKAAELVRDKRRCEEAARKFRHRTMQGRYASLRLSDSDDLDAVAAVLDSAGIELDKLPDGTRAAVLALVGRLLDDTPRRGGSVQPLTGGDGH